MAWERRERLYVRDELRRRRPRPLPARAGSGPPGKWNKEGSDRDQALQADSPILTLRKGIRAQGCNNSPHANDLVITKEKERRIVDNSSVRKAILEVFDCFFPNKLAQLPVPSKRRVSHDGVQISPRPLRRGIRVASGTRGEPLQADVRRPWPHHVSWHYGLPFPIMRSLQSTLSASRGSKRASAASLRSSARRSSRRGYQTARTPEIVYPSDRGHLLAELREGTLAKEMVVVRQIARDFSALHEPRAQIAGLRESPSRFRRVPSFGSRARCRTGDQQSPHPNRDNGGGSMSPPST